MMTVGGVTSVLFPKSVLKLPLVHDDREVNMQPGMLVFDLSLKRKYSLKVLSKTGFH